jgi:hypothetical protein
MSSALIISPSRNPNPIATPVIENPSKARDFPLIYYKVERFLMEDGKDVYHATEHFSYNGSCKILF